MQQDDSAALAHEFLGMCTLAVEDSLQHYSMSATAYDACRRQAAQDSTQEVLLNINELFTCKIFDYSFENQIFEAKDPVVLRYICPDL